MDTRELNFEEIKIGDIVEFTEVLSSERVEAFAELSGDTNPLHTDRDYAGKTQYGARIVHGMFLASFFSKLVGMYLPGKKCLYLGQELKFIKPVFIAETVKIRGEVTNKSDSTGVIQIKTTIENEQGEEVVTGVAQTTMLAEVKKKLI
jgi:3-hydroxybutyryl-CoA dehydratase